MVAYSLAQRLTPNVALIIAGTAGMLAALSGALLPNGWFESLVVTSGLAAFIPAAEPPLGLTARLCLGVAAGGGTALLTWFALTTFSEMVGPRRVREAKGPTVRRADAHPDAPPREPLRAGRDFGFDLDEEESLPVAGADEAEAPLPPEPVIARGTPAPTTEAIAPPVEPLELVAPPAVQPLPSNLDQPLAAFDPGAVPDSPMTPPRIVTPLRQPVPKPPVFEDGERFEAFPLDPPPALVAHAPITAIETEASVHSLLDRLERGMARRTREPAAASVPAPPPAPAGLQSALENLRQMAVRG